MKRFTLVFTLLAVALAAAMPLLVLAQGDPAVIGSARLPQSQDTKYPHVAVRGAEVLVASNADESVARLWAKPLTGLSFPNPVTMGPAVGKPDNNTASIFTTSDGVTHYAWSNQQERRVYLRTRAAGAADFGPARLVTGSTPDPVEVEVAAMEDGVFVFWRDARGPLKYRRSADGVSWSPPDLEVITSGIEPLLDVAAGSGRRLAVAYTRVRSEVGEDALQGYVAFWNGSSFVEERIPTATDRGFANPQVALMPDGGYATTLRSVATTSGDGAGMYVADRAANGTWTTPARLARGTTNSTALETDVYGNVHLYFISTESGRFGLYYTFRRPGQGYGGGAPNTPPATLLPVLADGTFLANARLATEVRDRSYSHAVSELFSGGASFVQYYQVGLPVEINGATAISIEGGAPLTNKGTVSVGFSGVTGPATGVRWSWDGPPAASVAYTTFDRNNPTINVPAPTGIGAGCGPRTLYTQLRGPTAEQAGTNSDSIVFDQAVQAEFVVSGPPSALNPGYTSSLSAVVTVFSAAECAGIASAAVSGPVEGGSVALPVAGVVNFSQTITLTGDPATPGLKELSFQATDQLGNGLAAPVVRSIVYDPVAPTLRGLAPETETTLVPNPKGTTELRLALDNLDAVDTGGVVAGLEIQVTGPPLNGAPIVSGPVRIPFSQMDRVTANNDGTLSVRATLSLLQFFSSEQLTPGSYSFTIRVLDGAGNASPESQTRSETLTTITYPTWTPLVRR